MPRISGLLLIAIGVLHTLVGVVAGRGPLAEIARAGFFKAVERDFPRMFIFWFLFGGFLFILLGHLCLWLEQRLGHRVPAFVGWELLALSVMGVVLMPRSGFWLLLAVAVYMILAARRKAPDVRPT